MDKLKITRTLFYLNATIWLAIGLLSLARLERGGVTPMWVQGFIALLILANAGAMLLAGWGLGRRRRLTYLFALAVVLVNILLTFTDQVGFLDWITLALDVVILGFLIVVWKIFYNPGR
jgi:lysylphosphatidylglycerol synthetase-like protein (DUF2156 family)